MFITVFIQNGFSGRAVTLFEVECLLSALKYQAG